MNLEQTPHQSEDVEATEDAAEVSPEPADEQTDLALEQELSQPLNIEPRKPLDVDMWRQQVEAATLPKNTDKIVFGRALCDMANKDIDSRIYGTKALGAIRHELTVRVLADQMHYEQSPKVRQECIKSLAAVGMKQGLNAVETALSDDIPAVRLVAVWALYRLAGEESLSKLTNALSDNDKEVRRRAITCIGWLAQRHTAVKTKGSIYFQKVVPALIRCLNEPDKSIKTAAVAALEAITGKKMIEQAPENEDASKDIIPQWQDWWRKQLFE